MLSVESLSLFRYFRLYFSLEEHSFSRILWHKCDITTHEPDLNLRNKSLIIHAHAMTQSYHDISERDYIRCDHIVLPCPMLPKLRAERREGLIVAV